MAKKKGFGDLVMEFLPKLLEALEGKEARTRVNLDGVRFRIGKSEVELGGHLEITFVPLEKRK